MHYSRDRSRSRRKDSLGNQVQNRLQQRKHKVVSSDDCLPTSWIDVGRGAGGFRRHCAGTGCWLRGQNRDQAPRRISYEMGMGLSCQRSAFKVAIGSRHNRCLTSPLSSPLIAVTATSFGFTVPLSRICLQNRTDYCESASWSFMWMAAKLHPFYQNKIR